MGLLAKDFMKNTIYSQKSELDQFFTNKDIAKQCYLELCKLYNINEFDLLLEPSAGDGSFLKLLPSCFITFFPSSLLNTVPSSATGALLCAFSGALMCAS